MLTTNNRHLEASLEPVQGCSAATTTPHNLGTVPWDSQNKVVEEFLGMLTINHNTQVDSSAVPRKVVADSSAANMFHHSPLVASSDLLHKVVEDSSETTILRRLMRLAVFSEILHRVEDCLAITKISLEPQVVSSDVK